MDTLVSVGSTVGRGKTDSIISLALGYALRDYSVIIYHNSYELERFKDIILEHSIDYMKIVMINERNPIDQIREVLDYDQGVYTQESSILIIDSDFTAVSNTEYTSLDYLRSQFDNVIQTQQLIKSRL